MKATEAKLLSFLQKSPQFIIPIYQRTYSWTDKQCRQLWDDILRAGSSDTVAVHFIGSIVYVEQGLSQVTHQAPLLVIDGQQRLTTVSLLIEALARALGDSEPIDGFSAAKLRHYYLSNPLEAGDRYFKLLLSQTDNASLKAIIKNTEPPKEPSLRVTQNFQLFTELLSGLKADLAPVCRGLAKLVVVDIALSRDQDNPQLIFESMNSTGKELSQADLIRNFILMGLEPALQTRLYEEYWRPMELSACVNGLNRRDWTSGAMPMPVSFTETKIMASVSETGREVICTSMRPPGVNFRAFETRLLMHWRTRSAS